MEEMENIITLFHFLIFKDKPHGNQTKILFIHFNIIFCLKKVDNPVFFLVKTNWRNE